MDKIWLVKQGEQYGRVYIEELHLDKFGYVTATVYHADRKVILCRIGFKVTRSSLEQALNSEGFKIVEVI